MTPRVGATRKAVSNRVTAQIVHARVVTRVKGQDAVRRVTHPQTASFEIRATRSLRVCTSRSNAAGVGAVLRRQLGPAAVVRDTALKQRHGAGLRRLRSEAGLGIR